MWELRIALLKAEENPDTPTPLMVNGFLAELNVFPSCQLWWVPGRLSAKAGRLSVAEHPSGCRETPYTGVPAGLVCKESPV